MNKPFRTERERAALAREITLQTGESYRRYEREYRAEGRFDVADICRQFADCCETGEVSSDVSSFDRGRMNSVNFILRGGWEALGNPGVFTR